MPTYLDSYTANQWNRLSLRLAGIDAWHLFDVSLHDELKSCKENLRALREPKRTQSNADSAMIVWLSIHRSDLLSAIGDHKSAVSVLANCSQIAESLVGFERNNASLLIQGRMAALQRELGQYSQSLEKFELISALIELTDADVSKRSQIEALLNFNRALIAFDTGDLSGAQEILKAAIQGVSDHSFEDPVMSGLIESECKISLADVFLRQGDRQNAANMLTDAVEIAASLSEAGLPGAETKQIRALGRLGSVLVSMKKTDEADAIFQNASSVYAAAKASLRDKFSPKLGSQHDDLVLRNLGELKAYFPTPSERSKSDMLHDLVFNGRFGVEYARLLMRICLFHLRSARAGSALAAADEGISIVCAEPFRRRTDLAPLRAVLKMYRGIGLRNTKKHQESVVCLHGAIWDLQDEITERAITKRRNLRELPEGEQRPDLDGLRSRILTNLGVSCASFGLKEVSLIAFVGACKLYEGPSIGPWLLHNVERCRLYANMSSVLEVMSSPHDWARDKSGRMSGMLELAPPEAAGPWSEMRSSFRSFHENWLRFAIAKGDVGEIPEILAALQGRDVGADVLDRLALETVGEVETIVALKTYQAARAKLRELAESIRDDGPGTFKRDDGLLLGSDGGALPHGTRNVREAKLLEEYRALHQQLPAFREAAAEVPGFEILRAPHRQVTQAWLRKSLGPDEAMLLAFVLDGVARVAVLRHNDRCKVVELRAAAGWSSNMERFSRSLSGRGGMRDGGWSFARDAGKNRPGSAAVVLMTEAELALFWKQTIATQFAHLWSPLTETLTGAKRVIGITHGRLMLVSLSAGAPKDLEIVQYPGLAFYALARGLFGERSETAQSTGRRISIVRGNHTDLQYSPLEEEASVALWRSAGAEVSHPDYPREGRVGLLHVTSHGDLLKDGSPVILLGRDESGKMRTLGERDILRGAAVEAAFLNLCLGGRLSEDPLDGSPSGLVSALMRRGAKVVVAALPPVDDLWSCVLGLMVTDAMATEGLPLDWALTVAKQQLGMGVPARVIDKLRDWHNVRLHEVVRDHCASHLQSPQACARAALEAALGSGEGSTLLTNLAAALAEVPEPARPGTAARLLATQAWWAFAEYIAKGPGPAEYGALVHGMIAFGESDAVR